MTHPVACQATGPLVAGKTADLGKRSFQGALWVLSCSTATKIIAITSQVLLAWFLLAEDYGLVAMATSITQIVALVNLAGLRQVLVQRSERFSEDAPQAFWLAICTTTLTYLILVAIAPSAARAFGEPRVLPLILVLGLSGPVGSLATVYSATLLKDLRFRILAFSHLSQAAVVGFAAVTLAISGFGAFSLALPPVFAVIVGVCLERFAVGPVAIGRPNPRRWLDLITPAMWLKIGEAGDAIRKYGILFVLGLLQGSQFTGLFFWGFTLSSQMVYLLSTSLRNVFFPAFAKLNLETERQYRAFATSCQALIALVAPICVLQAVTAEEVIGLLVHERWLPAANVVRWVSLGLLLEPLLGLSNSVLMARGRFRLLACLSTLSAGATMAAVAVSATTGSLVLVGVSLGACAFLTSFVAASFVVREFPEKSVRLLALVGPPLALACLAGLAGWIVKSYCSQSGPVVTLLGSSITTMVVYGILLRVTMPHVVSGALARFRSSPATLDRAQPTS